MRWMSLRAPLDVPVIIRDALPPVASLWRLTQASIVELLREGAGEADAAVVLPVGGEVCEARVVPYVLIVVALVRAVVGPHEAGGHVGIINRTPQEPALELRTVGWDPSDRERGASWRKMPVKRELRRVDEAAGLVAGDDETVQAGEVSLEGGRHALAAAAFGHFEPRALVGCGRDAVALGKPVGGGMSEKSWS